MKQDVVDKLPYVVKRHNKYGIRRRVPEDIRHIIGSKEISRSLGTGDPVQATEVYYRKNADIEAEFSKARRQLNPEKPKVLTKEMARHFAHSWFSEELDAIEDGAFDSLGVGNLSERLFELDGEEARLISGSEEEITPSLQALADKILIENGYPKVVPSGNKKLHRAKRNQANVDKGSDGYWELVGLVRRGYLEGLRKEISVLKNEPAQAYDSFFSTPAVHSSAVPVVSQQVWTLAYLIEQYLAIDNNRSDRTILDLRAAFRPMTEVIGLNTPIAELTPNDFYSVRELILRLPPNATKGNNRRNKSLQIIASENEKVGGTTLNIITANKYLARIAALMKWATEQWKIDRNPAEGLHISTKGLPSASERRSPFTVKALNEIFSYNFHSDPVVSKPSEYWAPLIALFHGMRLEEILQLTFEDVRQENGLMFLRLHNDGENHIKSGSGREVPLHPKMYEFGFASLLNASKNSKNRLLFSDVKRGSENKFGSAYSQRYSRNLENKICVKTPDTSFHSYRHNFRDACRNYKIDEELTCALGGWLYGSGAQKNYGSGHWMKQKSDALAKIDYPDVDFSKIKVIDWNKG